MKEFSTTVRIAAPATRVWQVLSDIERWHEWTPSVTSIHRLRDAPLEVGLRVLIRQPKLPPAMWTLTAIEAGRSFTWVSGMPGLQVVGEHAVEPDGSGSRATLTLRYRGVLGDPLARLTRGITERYVAYEGRGLKARSEDPSFHHDGVHEPR